jgi:hypothetical protein
MGKIAARWNMTRVSALYTLGISQGGLDFVDVDVATDSPVYIDPGAIRAQSGLWADECKVSLQTFFKELLVAIGKKDSTRIQALIYPLVEPNETHLGESVGQSRGRSLGSKTKADELIDALSKSKAVKTGMLSDLDDSAMFVEGIDKDIVSDIATCVIRAQLIEYTQKMCVFHGIPMEPQIAGPIWSSATLQWDDTRTVKLPRANEDKLLLVPKSIIRVHLTVDRGRYYRGYLRPYYEAEVLASPSSELVRVLKDKTVRVRLKALDDRLGTTKPAIVENTQKYPQALGEYKNKVASEPNSPISDLDMHLAIDTPLAEVRAMLEKIKAIAPGDGGATLYHHSAAELLTALFDTSLGNQRIEEDLHSGLKRVDVLYDNVASEGFFRWVSLHYPAALVVVECKNYSREIANPEFDQLGMRFAPDRGQVGILMCREVQNRDRALARAKSIASDRHGWVLVLDDGDLETMVTEYEAHHAAFAAGPVEYAVLKAQFDALINVN